MEEPSTERNTPSTTDLSIRSCQPLSAPRARPAAYERLAAKELGRRAYRKKSYATGTPRRPIRCSAGKRGGQKRMAQLSPQERIAKRSARSRWHPHEAQAIQERA